MVPDYTIAVEETYREGKSENAGPSTSVAAATSAKDDTS
jgi:hypothetical protein